MVGSPQLIGQTLSHYRIIEQIGSGGMGVVYRARDEQLERDVAVKVLPLGTLADESARKRFRKEALALAKLNHPSIATIFEFSTYSNTDYLVTEYISGLSLDTKLSAGSLSEKEVVGLGIQLAQGLGAAHQSGIVHRDLKPANLRLTSDGRLKILDFGLAQLMPHASEVGITATMTESQAVTGTLPYMSPEQLRGEPADVRTDIWAAGAVLYELATAHRPFEQKLPSALTDDIIHRAPRAPRSLRPALSPQLEFVILKCLQKEPVHRYQAASELQADLERLSAGVAPLATRRRLWPVLSVAAVLLALLGTGAVFYLRRSPKITDKDTIVLADFVNHTSDPLFDDTLKQGLSVSLSQSPFLNLMPEQKVSETLKLMGRTAGERITEQLAREICVRTNSKALLAGSISNLGSQYVIGLKAVNCKAGDALAQEQVQASTKEGVLKSLDKAAASVRTQLGESLSTVQKYDSPLEQVTTPSLEALQALTAATKQVDPEPAIALYKRAIELDPNFAAAYSGLGSSYHDLNENGLAAENQRKAYELRQRLSERERYSISAEYYSDVTGELEKADEVYEQWSHAYPRDDKPLGNVAVNYLSLGRYEQSAAKSLEAIHLNPDSTTSAAYNNLMVAYQMLNRFGEAKATYERALALNPEDPFLHGTRYCLAFLEGDEAEMQRQNEFVLERPGIEDLQLFVQSNTQAYSGRLRKSRELSGEAVQAAKAHDHGELVTLFLLSEALREAEVGNVVQARRQATSTMAHTPDSQIFAALSLARVCETTSAQAMADQLRRVWPLNTVLNSYWLPTIRASIELCRNHPDKAVELLQASSAYELGAPSLIVGTFYPVYVRGLAYLLAHRGDEAAAEFNKIIEHRGIAFNFPLGALAHLGVARAYAVSGDTTKSRTAYQDFLALWKDADPEIPILKEAKAEYAKLQ